MIVVPAGEEGRIYFMRDGRVALVQEPPWPAPDHATALRWVEEINGRGGYAEATCAFNGASNRLYRVQLIRAIPGKRHHNR